MFAFLADIGLITLGGALKRKEHLSGRYADAFAWLFLASCALKRFKDESEPDPHRPLLDWVVTKSLFEVETALTGVLANLPNRFVAFLSELIAFPLGSRHAPVTDHQTTRVVNTLTTPDGQVRNDLSNTVFIPPRDEPGLGALEGALADIVKSQHARSKIDSARRKGLIKKGSIQDMTAAARTTGLLSTQEAETIYAAERSRNDVIQVDHFDPETFKTLK